MHRPLRRKLVRQVRPGATGAQPVRNTYWMASNTRRIGHSRGRPVLAAPGMNGATTAHSWSVRQVA